MTKEPNFIFAKLGDNDFGKVLLEALEYVYWHKTSELTKAEYKYFITKYIVFKEAVRRISPNMPDFDVYSQAKFERYFDCRLEVTFPAAQPTVDDDGGSAVINTKTGHVWNV